MKEEMESWLKSRDSKEYFELLRFATVGADKTKLRECAACATWLKKWLERIGGEGEERRAESGEQRAEGEERRTENGERREKGEELRAESGGRRGEERRAENGERRGEERRAENGEREGEGFRVEVLMPEVGGGEYYVPVVFGELKGEEGATTVLYYGHYDVQPADPEELWESPPFEPTVKGDRVYCRGAQDDKGQTFAFLCGLREVIEEAKGSRINIKILLDGQEESGSVALFKLLEDREFRKRLSADVMLVCDTSAAAGMRPAIVAGLRGVNHFTVSLKAANRDLHSGEYGGVAPNAAQGMAELMASLHNPDGSIAVAGFRDGIEPPTHEEMAAAEAGMASEEEYAKDIGCETAGGQLGKTVVQRICFEPTIEVNGIHSGYGGAGSKTVIPCEAIAKVSTRLVPGQNARAAYEAVKRHLKDHCPRGMSVEMTELTGEAAGFRLPLNSPLFRLAEMILGEMDERGAVFQWDGASIPVVSALREASGAAPLMVGWGQSEDRIHSPNESYSVGQFRAAKEWSKRLVSAI